MTKKNEKKDDKINRSSSKEPTSNSMHSLWLMIRYYIVPPVFMTFFPALVIFLAFYGRDGHLNAFTWKVLLGNSTSWFTVAVFFLWAIVFLKIPGKIFHGPITEDGYSPPYKANGVLYYFSTVAVFLLVCWNSSLPTILFKELPEFLGTLNAIALVLCFYLWWRGKKNSKDNNLPDLFLFYRGVELHPRIWGIDVKQFTNCRMGMMMWQLQLLAYWIHSTRDIGINLALTVTVILQTVYICKFFYWETGYFTTLDITLDRAGFYLCWGCLVFIPGFLTFTPYIMTAQPTEISLNAALAFSVFGFIAVFGTYLIDLEKQVFRESNGQRSIWGGKPKSIAATYTIYRNGRPLTKNTYLLTSGMWGVARHTNYLFELFTSFFFCVGGWKLGIGAFLYFIFIGILIIHRLYRDEEKCATKYGRAWVSYCRTVPYRLIPYIF